MQGIAPRLLELSHAIHDDPELAFSERRAAARLTGLLADAGFEVERGIGGLETAFLAARAFGDSGPTIAVFCEYDALPGIGHGCGHNIIASAGVGAAIAAATQLAAAGQSSGRVVVVGSPAEEGGGGKTILLREGCLDGIDAAVMVHPAGFDAVSRTNLGRLSMEVTFAGKAAHAAAAPDRGINALDAATLLLVSIGLLRQQLRPDARVHAIVVDGGQSVNIIPEHAKLKVFARSPDPEYLRGRLLEAIGACVQGAAIATGAVGELYEAAPAYDPVTPNPTLAELVGEVFDAMSRSAPRSDGGPSGSTDMGNVSRVIPAVHPYLCVTPGLALHTREFAEAAGGPDGDAAVLDGAVLIGSTVMELFEPERLARVRETFAD